MLNIKPHPLFLQIPSPLNHPPSLSLLFFYLKTLISPLKLLPLPFVSSFQKLAFLLPLYELISSPNPFISFFVSFYLLQISLPSHKKKILLHLAFFHFFFSSHFRSRRGVGGEFFT